MKDFLLRLGSALPALLILIPVAALAEKETSHLPYPSNLARQATTAEASARPFLFMFSVDGCAFCETVRRNYLLPLSSSTDSPFIYEIKIGSGQAMIDFDGKKTEHAEFARRYNARLAPTVILMDHRGRQLTDPLVGGDTSGLYGGMLDKALYEANVKLSR